MVSRNKSFPQAGSTLQRIQMPCCNGRKKIGVEVIILSSTTTLHPPCKVVQVLPTFTFLFLLKWRIFGTESSQEYRCPLGPLRCWMWIRHTGITGSYWISLITGASDKPSHEREVLLNTQLPALCASKCPLDDGLSCTLLLHAVTQGAPVTCYPRLNPAEWGSL